MGKKMLFKNYLKSYCKDLTGTEDYRLSSFASKLNDNPRSQHPVFLYALMFPNEKYFKNKLNQKQLEEYSVLEKHYEKYKDIELMLQKEKFLIIEYRKVYDAYIQYTSDYAADTPLKRAYHEKILQMLGNRKISNYRICVDNNLNQGNFHSFLKGDYSKLSKDKCKDVYLYLQKSEI